MRTILAWESEEAKEKPSGGGWLYQDRPVAQEHWRKLKPHALEGLAVYQVADGTDADRVPRTSTGSDDGTGDAPSPNGSEPRINVRRGDDGGAGSVKQLQFQFTRSRVHEIPGQRSLLEKGAEKPSSASGAGNAGDDSTDIKASNGNLLSLAREKGLDPSILRRDDWQKLVRELETRMKAST